MNSELRAKTVLTAEEIQQVLRLGRNKSYEFLNSTDCPIPTIRIGHQIRVPSKQFFTWLDSLTITGGTHLSNLENDGNKLVHHTDKNQSSY